MKKAICFIFPVLLLFLFSGCHFTTPEERIANTEIDIGESDIYTEDDREAAVQLVIDEVSNWSCVETVYSITYAGDERSEREIGIENGGKQYDTVMVFLSDFRTGKTPASSGFNSDCDYPEYGWIVAITDDGEYKLVDWGY